MSDSPKQVEVSWADQQNINKFGRFHTRSKEIQAEIEKLTGELEIMKDALSDIDNLLDEDSVKVRIGEIFFEGTNEEGQEWVQKTIDRHQQSIADLQSEDDKLNVDLAELKDLLTAKFGNSIRLD